MEIENHKEEVPFEHYAGLFAQADAKEMAERTGVEWDGKEFYVNLLGTVYAIAHPVYGIRVCQEDPTPALAGTPSQEGVLQGGGHCPATMGSDKENASLPGAVRSTNETQQVAERNVSGHCPLPVQTFLLRYLLEGKAVAWGGGWKTFREMPWGELYIKPYTGRVLTRAAFTFGTRLAAFQAACEKLGATPVKHGDAGYELALLGDYRMQVLVWEGDDEFPPNAQVLYSDNFENGFAPEDRVVAGDILISAIKSEM